MYLLTAHTQGLTAPKDDGGGDGNRKKPSSGHASDDRPLEDTESLGRATSLATAKMF
jgi:hypothetical protein